jgi:hypothetical protein
MSAADNKVDFSVTQKRPDEFKNHAMSYKATEDGIVLSNGYNAILIPSNQVHKMYEDMCKQQGKEVILRPAELNIHSWKAR